MPKRTPHVPLILPVCACLAWAGDGPAAAAPVFEEAADRTGLIFRHDNGMNGELYFVEMMGAGGALFDYDGDGDLDVYLVQGGPLGAARDTAEPGALPSDRLFRNDGVRSDDGSIHELRFTDVTDQAGLGGTTGYGMGVAVGDYDADGDLDLYLTNFGPNQMMMNTGDGRFVDVTDDAGVEDDRWSVPAVFFDHDGDGDQDLFVGNYVAYDIEENRPCRSASGFRDYCSPLVFPPSSDRLFENDGEGRFENVTVRENLTRNFGAALGVIVADFDRDGSHDLFVANDGTANQLWMKRDGGFRDEGPIAGVSVNMDGSAEASMGVDVADFDEDGDDDLFMTHLAAETNTLYVNDGGGWFDDRTVNLGLAGASLPFTGFGTGFLDYDLDGVLDLLAVNGAVTRIPEQVEAGSDLPLRQRDQLFHGLGGGRFQEIPPEQAGPPFMIERVGRGAAFGDVDEDGDVDVLVTDNGSEARLLLNRAGDGGRWLGLIPRTEPGVAVTPMVRAALECEGHPTLWRTGRRTRSYASSSDPRIIFGLDDRDVDDCRVLVLWPDGRRRVLRVPEADRYQTIDPRSGIGGEG